MRDPIVHLDAFKSRGRIYLRGLTDINDWKLLAVFDEQTDLDAWLDKGVEAGWLEKAS